MKRLTISIVNYNAGDYLLDCLQSIEDVSDEATITTYVVDNASVDDSIERAEKKFPKVIFIKNKDNLGFGKAHNIVLKKLKDEYVLILNPDTKLEKGVLKAMLSFMEDNPEVGASTCEIILSNGKVDLTAHRGFPTPIAAFRYYLLKDDSLYHLSKKDLKSIHEVDAISGSFLLARKEAIEATGGFDEDYFMYAEDIDICYKMKQAGFKIMYVPTVSILHHKGISTGVKQHSQKQSTASMETKRKMTDYFYETMKIFYRKHYEKEYPFFINWLVYLGINLKWWMAKRKLTV